MLSFEKWVQTVIITRSGQSHQYKETWDENAAQHFIEMLPVYLYPLQVFAAAAFLLGCCTKAISSPYSGILKRQSQCPKTDENQCPQPEMYNRVSKTSFLVSKRFVKNWPLRNVWKYLHRGGISSLVWLFSYLIHYYLSAATMVIFLNSDKPVQNL